MDEDDQPPSDLFTPSLEEMMQNATCNNELDDIVKQIIYSNASSEVAPQQQAVPPGQGLGEPVQLEECRDPTMDVKLHQRVVRFRYETELGNRNIGREELLTIKFVNLATTVHIRMHTIDTKNRKAHPYSLIGEHCKDGVYYQQFVPSAENNCSCVCKATIKIPTRQKYETELSKRRTHMTNTIGLTTEDMKRGDYWSTNKNMRECQSICICVEAFYDNSGSMYMLKEITKPVRDAKSGKNFEIYTIRPFSAPCTGIPVNQISDYMLIVLSVDSYVPRDCEVWFFDEEGWRAKATNIKIIKNVLEFEIPPYKKIDLIEPKKVSVEVKDTKGNIETPAKDFFYKPTTEEVIIERKRRKRVNWDNIPLEVRQEAGIDVSHSGPKEDSRNRMRKYLEAKRGGKSSTVSSTVTGPQSNPNSGILPAVGNITMATNDPQFPFTAPSVLAPSCQTSLPAGSDFSSYQNMTSNYLVDDIPDLMATAAQPQHTGPPMQQNNPTGPLRTVNIKGTNTWILIDQNNKPIHVIGSNESNETQVINEIPPSNLSMPTFSDITTNFQPNTDMGNYQSNTFTSSFASTIDINDLETDVAEDRSQANKEGDKENLEDPKSPEVSKKREEGEQHKKSEESSEDV